MADASATAARLEQAFMRIHTERMDGVPILNPRLAVEAVGAKEWNGCTLAVLVTPWFINLMLLPETPETAAQMSAQQLGASVVHRFPAGRFDFLVGEESEIGRYQMCSLFSPVLEFEDHEAARIAATASLEALFDASLDPAAEAAKEEENATPPDTGAARQPTEAQPAPESAPEAPVAPSRRGFLTGRLAPREGSV